LLIIITGNKYYLTTKIISTYSTYNTKVEIKLANTSEIFYDEEMKRDEMNNTISEILRDYDIPAFKKRAEITFDSNGLAALPSDYFRMVKLWDVDSNSVQTNEYHYIVEDEFDTLAATTSFYWTEDYVVADAARKLKILPTDAGTLQIRYIKTPTTLEDASTESGLSSDWDEAVVFGTCYRLFMNAGRINEAGAFKGQYDSAVGEVMNATKNRGGIKENNRIRSVFERRSLLGGFQANDYDCTR